MQVFIIDTFTSNKFRGNPTAVCLPEQMLPDGASLSVARELNLPVTAFVEKDPNDSGLYSIRYFTATREIPACGHATLASAGVVFELFSTNNAVFRTCENSLIETEKYHEIIRMTYPKYELISFPDPSVLLKSLQIDSFLSAGFCKELETLFVELDSPAVLRNIQPDYKELVESSDMIKEVVIMSVSDDKKYDFLLRSFCPWIGINEDPVTGSVHSVLAGFWGDKLRKQTLRAFQASERGGEVYVSALDNKVYIGGYIAPVMKGKLFI